MRVYEQIKALPPVGIGNLLPKKICTTALAFVTVIACATSASAQSVPDKADSISASATLSSAQSAKAHTADAKKKKKPAPKPDPNPSAAAMSAPSQASGTAQGTQAQNPLTPLWGVINENYTNFSMGPLHKTQNVLVVEPVFPLKLTPDWNLVTRWNTPIMSMPRLAEPLGPFPGIGPESVLVTCSRSSSLRQHIRARSLLPWDPHFGYRLRPTRHWESTSGVAGRSSSR